MELLHDFVFPALPKPSLLVLCAWTEQHGLMLFIRKVQCFLPLSPVLPTLPSSVLALPVFVLLIPGSAWNTLPHHACISRIP